MSKKDYQALAAALYRVKPFADREPGHSMTDVEAAIFGTWCLDRDAIADVLQAGNPRFDRKRFIEACETSKCRGMRQVS